MPCKTQDSKPDQHTKFLPNFTKEELDETDDIQRKEYWTSQRTGKEEEEKPPEERKIKMRDALAKLEKLPRKDGEWVKGEVRYQREGDQETQQKKVPD